MYPCVACHRHLRSAETRCPFCGAAQHELSASPPKLVTLLVAAALGCFGSVACGSSKDSEPAASDGQDESESSAATGEVVTTWNSSTSTATETGTDMIFIEDEWDASAYANPCYPLEQNCPEGEKCVPYSSSGDEEDPDYPYTDGRCVPILGDGQSGDPCTYSTFFEATDDCDESTMCFQLQQGKTGLEGVCEPFCTGTYDDPICPEGSSCYIDYSGDVALCLADCSPLAPEPECPAGQSCAYALNGAFSCAVVPEQPTLGEPCIPHIDACAAHEVCAEASRLLACDGDHCCAALCELEAPNCADPMLGCEPFYEDLAPAGLETLGWCVLPL